LRRFDNYNKKRHDSKYKIKPYNFVAVSTLCSSDLDRGKPINSLIPYIAPQINGKTNGKFPAVRDIDLIDHMP